MRFCFSTKKFIEQDSHPDAKAVIGMDFELTWREFEERVNLFCDTLKGQNAVDLKHPVLVYGHKSANVIVAFYALMHLEIPYIPVDVIFPKERIEKIIEISQSQLLINTTVEDVSFENVQISRINPKGILSEIDGNELLKRAENPLQLVYIIFTSGSTGEPKGVQITTEAVQSYTKWLSSDFGFGPDDVFVNTTVLSFDLSTYEVFSFAALGGAILLTDKETASVPDKMAERIAKYKGTIWISTPSFAINFTRLEGENVLNSVKQFILAGEMFPNKLAKTMIEKFPQAKIRNSYGPTEATNTVTLVDISLDMLEKYPTVPVGPCKPESEILIEDKEIVLVGPNISIGYIGRPELTAEKFVTRNGQRAFKTGDEGYFLDGMLFYSGRNDDMVKLHGYRIELNEITATINNLPSVHQCATLPLKRNDEVKKIVSVVQLKTNHAAPSKEEIQAELSKTLPPYMIPSDIKFVESIPLSTNGKIDKNKLTEIYLNLK